MLLPISNRIVINYALMVIAVVLSLLLWLVGIEAGAGEIAVDMPCRR
jgi:hypothetical protein